ncbi:MAG: D-alanyl-lipoteichoic acid biosynthesis protein DltD [Chthoniobacteraceae bacterium]
MSATSTPPSDRSHLRGVAIAMLLAAVGVAMGLDFCGKIEARYIHALAPEFSEEKLQGAVLQREAFRQPNLLMMYGSSELAKEMPNNPVQFFKDYPTGFTVFPVGKPGATSLNILQKLAAVGSEARGRKLAYSISPGWFLAEETDVAYYEGNFSTMQAMALIFSGELSVDLKRDIACRMLEFPTTTDNAWLLDFAVRRLVGDSRLDRALYSAVVPLGKLQNAIGRGQDHLEAALHILDEDEKLNPATKSVLRALNWADILKSAGKSANAKALSAKQSEVTKRRQMADRTKAIERAKKFRAGLEKSDEWTDFELLLRTCRELGAKPLFLCMPLEDARLEVSGLGAENRLAFLQRLQSMAGEFKYPLLLFREHEKDPAFLFDFQDHLSGEGWLYYNKALDDFFHDRI